MSIDGGTEPVWAASGRELFFRAGSKMMVVASGVRWHVGANRPSADAYSKATTSNGRGANYDVTADGKQFVMVRTANANTRTLSVRLNWTTELERLAPIQP